jgi:hypothetical protein
MYPADKPHLRHPLLRLGRRQMRVKLCRRCPYLPHDLAGHYDPEAALHLCAKCDSEPWMLANHYPRDSYRRRQCTTTRDVFETTQQSVARSATETLVSSATTPANPRPLFKEVRRSLQSPPGSRPQMVPSASGRLTAVATRVTLNQRRQPLKLIGACHELRSAFRPAA